VGGLRGGRRLRRRSLINASIDEVMHTFVDAIVIVVICVSLGSA
jgi:hypothetical protein